MTDGTHRCKTCRWDRLNVQDRSCWKCGGRDLEELIPEIVLEQDDAMSRLRKLATGVNDTWPYTGTSSCLTRYQCGLCDGVHYANKAPDVWPCLCTRFYEAS